MSLLQKRLRRAAKAVSRFKLTLSAKIWKQLLCDKQNSVVRDPTTGWVLDCFDLHQCIQIERMLEMNQQR